MYIQTHFTANKNNMPKNCYNKQRSPESIVYLQTTINTFSSVSANFLELITAKVLSRKHSFIVLHLQEHVVQLSGSIVTIQRLALLLIPCEWIMEQFLLPLRCPYSLIPFTRFLVILWEFCKACKQCFAIMSTPANICTKKELRGIRGVFEETLF